MDFVVSADQILKRKESEKIDKFLDLARGLKKLRNTEVMVILIIVSALGTLPKDLEKKLKKWRSEGK